MLFHCLESICVGGEKEYAAGGFNELHLSVVFLRFSEFLSVCTHLCLFLKYCFWAGGGDGMGKD